MLPIERDHCVFTNQRDLEHLYTFRNFPVFMGCVDSDPASDLATDMSWWISRNSGSIQLNPLLPLDVLYSQSHGSGSIGATWMAHHQQFAEFVSSCNVNSVLEIGGGHGILAQKLLALQPDVSWTIIEPNPTVPSGSGIKVIRGFFSESTDLPEPVDAIVHSHLLEHIYEPLDFLQQIAKFLPEDGKVIFAVPNLEVMLKRGYTNCINFEHTIFLTEPYIEYSLAKVGYRIEKKQYFLDDHSIFYFAQRDNAQSLPKINLSRDLYARNKQTFENYIQLHEKLVSQLNMQMKNSDVPVYLFGGHIFSQYLLAFGLDASRIECILDNDPKKQGKRLYGSLLGVKSPKILRDVQRANVILRAGAFQNEIKNDIVQNINPNIDFWE